MEVAARHASQADVFLIVGTSMAVYPAAGLIHYVRHHVMKYVVDPKLPDISSVPFLKMIEDKASTGMEKVKTELLSLF
jgi:NAD-dependent deacetylase